MKKQKKQIKASKPKAVKGPSIQPLADRVLVKRIDALVEKSPSGLIMPDSVTKEKSKMGIVIAVGPGRISDEGKMIPMSLKIGAKIIFNAGWDNEVDMGDSGDHFLVKESDILAVMK